MNVENEILKLLKEAYPKALPLRFLTLHVYNMKNNFFDPVDKEEVNASVGYYLRTASKKSGSPVMKTDTKGWYILNPSSEKVQQLCFEFESNEKDSDIPLW